MWLRKGSRKRIRKLRADHAYVSLVVLSERGFAKISSVRSQRRTCKILSSKIMYKGKQKTAAWTLLFLLYMETTTAWIRIWWFRNTFNKSPLFSTGCLCSIKRQKFCKQTALDIAHKQILPVVSGFFQLIQVVQFDKTHKPVAYETIYI